jgi:hypothetical protein
MEVVPGTELEQKCQARTALDALALGPEDCPVCVEETRERERRNANMCGDAGCPFTPFGDKEDPCASTCMFMQACRDVKDSPYQDQLRGIPANA